MTGCDRLNYKIYKYESLDSTNTKAKELALRGAGEATLVICEEQTRGRGRMGRSWTSTKGKDLLFSIILKPKLEFGELQRIILAAAVAVNRALKDLGIESQIKWPNDIIIGGKKVAGILMETSTSGDKTKHVILGIGINVNQDREDIPDELKDKSISLKLVSKREIDRKELLDYLLVRIKESYLAVKNRVDMEELLKAYKENSSLTGREVMVLQGKARPRRGTAIDIGINGELVVRFPEGVEKISYGEVSIRGIDGYT